MERLFIIGNGFDIAHGLKTKYSCFQKYLRKNYQKASSEELVIPSGKLLPKGGNYYKEEEVVNFFMYIISQAEVNGEEWNDLEDSLGRLDFSECFEEWFPVLDREGDYDDWGNMHNRQAIAEDIIEPILKISDYFIEWVSTINERKAQPKESFKRLIDIKNDFFLTFNYTKTLELIYGVMNICHIHGEIEEELYFGHGQEYDEKVYEENLAKRPGTEYSLLKIHNALRKNTKEALENNLDFFENMTDSIKEIYSYGFSFSEVDLIYIQEICSRIDTERATWYLNEYEKINFPAAFSQYVASIKRCGFKGKIGVF
ncbi:bacteriophage abortive infection AbiH family protein [uncultured Anaeromusa sp.]|uniref:bacteriophage abortive infection AbiH family protein n=1 Tax=uncultured Anaeromusa sp. TaxID=673273 RepID=UPI0029C8F9AE|nr:bacteriophage abortive infection AbiH family protein [uncultured Anaeromusa sp.]